MSRWLVKFLALDADQKELYSRCLAELQRKVGWKLTDDQIEYVLESVKAGKRPEIARLSQLASIPNGTQHEE